MNRQYRVCAVTGLGLVSSPERVFRVAKTSYGALEPKPREFKGYANGSVNYSETLVDGDPRSWSRFDTEGRTVYACDSLLTCYLELLAPFRTTVADQRRALEPAAKAMGMSLKTYWSEILREWDEQGNMNAMWLPRVFREGRAIYTLSFPQGWWVDVNSSQTLSALDDLFPEGIQLLDKTIVRNFTASDLTSDSREITTAIASVFRNQIELDDGSLPLGVHFNSKHGTPTGDSGVCWAYWQRAVDSGLIEPTKVLSVKDIDDSDQSLKEAEMLCKIKLR